MLIRKVRQETGDRRQDQETVDSRLETVDMRQDMRDRKIRPGT